MLIEGTAGSSKAETTPEGNVETEVRPSHLPDLCSVEEKSTRAQSPTPSEEEGEELPKWMADFILQLEINDIEGTYIYKNRISDVQSQTYSIFVSCVLPLFIQNRVN